jgi:hypothetical protein
MNKSLFYLSHDPVNEQYIRRWTLILMLLGAVLPLGVAVIHRLLGWALYPLGIVSFVWQGAQLVEGCILIGNHLKRKSTGE